MATKRTKPSITRALKAQVKSQALPNLNTEQLADARGLPLGECKHVTQSRAIPETDFAGYLIKVAGKDGMKVMKVCEQHAVELQDATVARVAYFMVGHPFKPGVLTKAKNYFKQLDKGVADFEKTGAKISSPAALFVTANGQLGGIGVEETDRELQLARHLNTGGRFVTGIGTAEMKGEEAFLFIATGKTTTQTVKDIGAFKKFIESKQNAA